MSAATMTLNPGQLHRKPVPAHLQQHPQQPAAPAHPHPHATAAAQYSAENYSRPRAPSNSPTPSPVYGSRAPAPAPQQAAAQQPPPTNGPPPRFSSASSSLTGTTAAAHNTATPSGSSGIQRIPTNSSMPRRSTSSRSAASAASPTSYVALMRKQKATVWCDRAQHEDPHLLAKARAAKMRAAMEVAGGKHHGSNNRVSTSSSIPSGGMGIRGKIRHQGAPKAHTYAGGANMSGAGVPIRLSATEMDESTSDEEEDAARFAMQNKRSGSGRSSNGSAGPRGSGGYLGLDDDATPPAGHSPAGSMEYIAEEQTPVPNATNMNQSDYFEGSMDDAEAEQRFGGVGGLRPSKPKTEQDIKREEELRRRGSVDDRAMTMSAQRLFVANPDLSD